VAQVLMLILAAMNLLAVHNYDVFLIVIGT
jgi:hypothetical protein